MTSTLFAPTPPAHPEPPRLPRQRGAPQGNQNARKTGVYGKHDDIWSVFLAAREVRGLTDEIAMLRVRIKLAFTQNAPLEEILRALDTLNRLLVTHHRLMLPEGDPPYED